MRPVHALAFLVLPTFAALGDLDTVELTTLDGKTTTRPAAGFETKDPREQGAHLVHFDVTSAPIESAADTCELTLAGGERWIGKLTARAGEELAVTLLPNVVLIASIDELATLVYRERIPAEWTGTLGPAKEGDRLYRVQGNALDVLDGAIEEFTAQGVRFHGARVDSRTFAWNEVAALYVEGLGAHAAQATTAAGVPVRVELVQGSRVKGALKQIGSGKLALTARRDQTIELPLGALRELFVDDGRAVWLSDLSPTRAEESRPFGDDLGMTWKHQIDRSVTGRPLRAAGRAFAHGIGVHAPSTLAWKVEPDWKTLRGRVAIDDETQTLAARGAVQFRVIVDGKKAWESPVVRGGDAPVQLPPIDLANATELVLEVDPGPESFRGDRADWLELLVVR
ncbi:MAG: NPCBM/NEW2 domain-containing protein [Planctomycetes bacterium]|nr:NPCBM/NEW2 domain-containing protein [Planctomycetota bacterium]